MSATAAAKLGVSSNGDHNDEVEGLFSSPDSPPQSPGAPSPKDEPLPKEDPKYYDILGLKRGATEEELKAHIKNWLWNTTLIRMAIRKSLKW